MRHHHPQISVLLPLHGGSGEEAVRDQHIDFEDVENNSSEDMVEMANMRKRLNVLGNVL